VQTAQIAVKKRLDVGKGAVKRLRRKGMVPGVIYGNNVTNINMSIAEKELRKMPLGSGQIVKVVVDGKSNHNVLVRDYQKHPITQAVIHLDLFEVSMTEKLTTTIALAVTGSAKGEALGGILQPGIREVEIECLPANILERIDIDVSDLEIGDMIKVKDLVAPSGITILTNPEQIIVSVLAPQYEEKIEEEKEGETPATQETEPEEAVEAKSEA